MISALKKFELPDGTHDPEDIAVAIEAELFKVHKGVTDKYRSALRSRVFNLMDKKNPALRFGVLFLNMFIQGKCSHWSSEA